MKIEFITKKKAIEIVKDLGKTKLPPHQGVHLSMGGNRNLTKLDVNQGVIKARYAIQYM